MYVRYFFLFSIVFEFSISCNRTDRACFSAPNLKNIDKAYVKEKAIFSFWPINQKDTVIKNDIEPSIVNLNKYSLKKKINIQLVDNFEDSVAIYINKKFITSGFFKSNYQATNTLYSPLQFKIELINTKKEEYAQIYVVMPWKKVYLDTLVPLRHSNIYIYRIDSWVLKFK